MEKGEESVKSDQKDSVDVIEESEPIELVLFQVSECYVYLIPPRKTAASYRADEWNVNKWAWEGTLKVVSKGEECIIRLEDKSTGELYARAFLRKGEAHPVESVIDSSRYFVLRIEENIGGRVRHAFIGIGFRERTEAYDFQAALHDHMKYLNKKQTAEEMEQQFQNTSSVDYSLKEGETIHLQIKNKSGGRVKSAFFEQGLNNLSIGDKGDRKEPTILIKPPPPPGACLSPSGDQGDQKEPTILIEPSPPPPACLSPSTSVQKSPSNSGQNLSPGISIVAKEAVEEPISSETQNTQDSLDDDFGDFQAAG